MWLVDLISWNQKPGFYTNPIVNLFYAAFRNAISISLPILNKFFQLCIFLDVHIFFCWYLTSDFLYLRGLFFLLSLVFYILHVIRSCIVRFLIGSKFPPSSFLFLPNSVSSSIGLFTTVKMFPTSLSYMLT